VLAHDRRSPVPHFFFIALLSGAMAAKANPELSLNVISAQLPPQPLSFEVDTKKYVLYTFMDEKGKRLDPYQFKIGLTR